MPTKLLQPITHRLSQCSPNSLPPLLQRCRNVWFLKSAVWLFLRKARGAGRPVLHPALTVLLYNIFFLPHRPSTPGSQERRQEWRLEGRDMLTGSFSSSHNKRKAEAMSCAPRYGDKSDSLSKSRRADAVKAKEVCGGASHTKEETRRATDACRSSLRCRSNKTCPLWSHTAKMKAEATTESNQLLKKKKKTKASWTDSFKAECGRRGRAGARASGTVEFIS